MRRAINIIFTLMISVGLILLGVFIFSSSYLRFWETLQDFGRSIGYYFCEVFGIPHNITPTVNDLTQITDKPSILPDNFDGFKNNALIYFSLLVNKSNFNGWLSHIAGVITEIMKVSIILIPCFIGLWFYIKHLYGKHNTKYGKDTVPLRVFKAISRFTYQPIKRFVQGYAAFIRENRYITVCWLIVCLLHLNVASIVFGFLAYYFWFAVEFDFGTVYTQIVKLFTDLKTPFIYFPYWTLLFAIYPLFNRFRHRIARGKLRRYEARNCGFINELPIVSITCGSMGKKKTTAITDMALSQEVMFRQKAFDILQQNDMKFPQFPWIKFEKELQACMEHGTVYNLATAKDWVRLKRSRFMRHGNVAWQLYGYNINRYGFTYDNGLSVCNLFDVLETYAQTYFIYVIESSLIVANYSIRTDNRLIDEGNFPIWLTDFFSRNYCRCSRHAHILDFDILRLGKKVKIGRASCRERVSINV